MHHPNRLEEYMDHEPFCRDDEEASYLWSCELDESTSTIAHRLTLFLRESDGRYARVVETHRQRAYAEGVVRRLLGEAGFARVEAFADFSFEPIDDADAMRMFFAAKKE